MSSKLEIYLQGGRFDLAEGFPLESLPALRAVGKLIESIARDLFFSENPDRKRVPSGFKKGFMPALTRLKGGSADCDISGWDQADSELANYFNDAQSETFSLLQALQEPKPSYPPWCSRRTKKQLASFLAAVDENETLRLSVQANGVAPAPVTIGFEQRTKAKTIAHSVALGKAEDFAIAGRIYAIENDPWAIRVKVREGGRRLRIPIEMHLQAQAREEFDADDGHLVLIRGDAERDDDTGSRTFVTGTRIERIGGPSITQRLAQLASLTDGWIDDDEDSRGPSKALCRWVERQLWQAIEDRAWNRPYLFATRSGGVDAIWRFRRLTLRACFSSRPLEVRLKSVNIEEQTSSVSNAARSLSPLLDWAGQVMEAGRE